MTTFLDNSEIHRFYLDWYVPTRLDAQKLPIVNTGHVSYSVEEGIDVMLNGLKAYCSIRKPWFGEKRRLIEEIHQAAHSGISACNYKLSKSDKSKIAAYDDMKVFLAYCVTKDIGHVIPIFHFVYDRYSHLNEMLFYYNDLVELDNCWDKILQVNLTTLYGLLANAGHFDIPHHIWPKMVETESALHELSEYYTEFTAANKECFTSYNIKKSLELDASLDPSHWANKYME